MTTQRRPSLEIEHRADGQWIVKVDGNPRRYFDSEQEAKAFIDGFDNCYDNITDRF